MALRAKLILPSTIHTFSSRLSNPWSGKLYPHPATKESLHVITYNYYPVMTINEKVTARPRVIIKPKKIKNISHERTLPTTPNGG